jgi:hypothetical protein
MSRLEVRPITLRAANAYVAANHRHSQPVRGCRFCVAAYLDGALVGVAIVGRTLARQLHADDVAEVLRVATNNTPNACSLLYGACSRAWRAMGGRRLVTYTRADEPGSSLRGAGWVVTGTTGAQAWDRPSRERAETTELIARTRWEPQWCGQLAP